MSLFELMEEGVSIVPSVLSARECDTVISELWDHLEFVSHRWKEPIKRDDEKSWEGIENLGQLHGMLMKWHQIGHAQFVWNVRQNEKIVKIFADLWNVEPEDLLVSFDGISFHLGKLKGKYKKWYHVDQSYTNSEFECIQGWLTLYDVKEDDATLAYLSKSHQYHEECAKEFSITKEEDWNPIHNKQVKFYEKRGCELKYVKCPRGSLVLWDSRLVHFGAQPRNGASNRRFVIYLCYSPRAKATNHQLRLKTEAFDARATTSHYPEKVQIVTSKAPVKKGLEIVYPEYVVLNDLGRRLAGFID